MIFGVAHFRGLPLEQVLAMSHWEFNGWISFYDLEKRLGLK